MEIFALIVLAILVFAIYGFISFLTWLFKPSEDDDQLKVLQPGLTDDVRGAERLLEHLFLTGKIRDRQYHRIRDALEQQFAEELRRKRIGDTNEEDSSEISFGDVETRETNQSNVIPPESEALVSAELVPAPVHPLEAEEPEAELVVAPPVPRRSFAEMLAGFMEKRNIRWGELASGLLIVGSAVGLVISLREELRDRIPYFSALVFMLITAGIHGVGTYTLKRWKLRNTSRGILVIGMLLIPLNFLAACMLNGAPEQRRSLSDPLLWIAVVTGTIAFSAMSWFSTRNLFRIRHAGIALAVVVGGLTILVTNRLDGFSGSILTTWLIAGFSFIVWHVGVLTSAPNILKRNYASNRFRDRLITIAGIGLFGLVCVVAMILIRSDQRTQTLLTLTPLIASVGIGLMFVGDRLIGSTSTNESDSLPASLRTTNLVGRRPNLFGWMVLLFSMAGSLFHPLVTLATGVIVIVMAVGFRSQRRISGLATAAWIALAATILVGAAVASSRIEPGTWSSFRELATGLSHSQSGIASLLAGGIAVLAAVIWKRLKGKPNSLAESNLARVISEPLHRFSVAQVFAASAASVGFAWILLASVVHRSDWWDVNLGTIAIVTAAIGALVLTAIRTVPIPTKNILVALILLAGFHLLQWNRFFSEFFLQQSWLSNSNTGFDSRAISFSAISSLLVGASAFVARNQVRPHGLDPLRIFGWLLVGATAIAALWVSPIQATWTTVALLISGIASVLLFASSRPNYETQSFPKAKQVLVSLIVVALVANLVVRLGIADSLNKPRHALLQFGALATLSAVAQRLSVRFQTGDWKWILHVVAGMFLAWFTMGLGNLCSFELVAGYDNEVAAWLKLQDVMWPIVATCLVIFVAQLVVAEVSTPTIDGVLSGLILVAIATSFAIHFSDAHAVATVCRWLVPIGVAAVAVPIGCRKLLPQRIRSVLQINATESKQQKIINVLLSVAVIVVLGLSTIAIARFLLVGTEALGGPIKGTWLGDGRKDIAYGGPVGLIVATFLWFAITERRCFLAMAGSGVFQYVVLLSMVLLFLSPHPKLASTWFINIMQAISLGMTGYGFVWLWQRTRIGQGAVDFGMTQAMSRWKMLDAHAVINVLLVLSMVVLIFQRYFFFPIASGGWITSAGSFLGIGSAIAVTSFAVLLWRKHVSSLVDLFLMLGGLAVVAFVAAAVDRFQSNGNGFIPWSSYRTLAGGSLLVVAALVAKTLLRRPDDKRGLLALRTSLPDRQARYTRIAIGAAIGVSFLFCIFGVDADLGGSQVYLVGSGVLIFAMACHAYFFCSWFVGFAVLPMVWIFSGQLVSQLGFQLHNQTGPTEFEVFLTRVGATGVVAALWIGIDWLSIRLKRATMSYGFFVMPILVTAFGSLIVWGSSTLTFATATTGAPLTISGFHWLAVFGIGTAWLGQFWSRKGRCRIFAGLLTAASMFTLLVCYLPESIIGDAAMRMALVCLASALTLLVAANGWARFPRVCAVAKKFHAVGIDKFEQLLQFRLPIWFVVVGSLIFLFATIIVGSSEWRAARMTASFSALIAASSAIVFSTRKPTQRIQLTAILASVAAFVLIGISGEGVTDPSTSGLAVFLRGLLVPALSVFIFGVFATRWLRTGDSWELPIRNATAVLTVTTLIGSVFFLLLQREQFDHDLGSGIGVPRAIALIVVLMGMVLGLLMIAVVPKRDPFSLSLDGRKGYVYVAQVVCIIAAAHIYLSMPWLLKTGILKYWPYLGIAVSMAGLIVSEVLKRRGLEVLREPVFNTAALIPVLVSIGYWIIDSRSDASFTFLLAGLIYLGIAIRYNAAWSGAMSMLLGNISLWLFYSDRAINFSEHPQLWLIPPAICVLVATWLERRWLTAQQLTAVRYACVFTIYLSSTAEVLINGFGQQLWPPMVLAILSIAGMAAGIMLQVRSFLFVGVSFLFLSVIAMVSHAHQRLDHVWPWWAFGILMGAAILAVFGFFEKRRNDLVRIGKQMQEWDG